ncbi:MAG: sulfatase family protein [Candidatus Cyclobacteriaceae bacterium M3_2C_046]
MNYSKKLVFLFTFCLFFGCSTDQQQSSPQAVPNILFCISDDQSFADAGAYGNDLVKTPVFDQLAQKGLLFTNAFASVPACAPSRASILTGRNFYELEEAACHFSFFPAKFKVYTQILEQQGYATGFTGKGWGPGLWEKGGWTENPTGDPFNQQRHQVIKGISDIDYAQNFKDFYEQKGDKPFCFWYGGMEAHRGFPEGQGYQADDLMDQVKVPPLWPDQEKVKRDILDYYFEINWFDTQLGRIINFLKEQGDYENTLIVVTSDNGMPFPRIKSNLYEYGIHMPLVISWENGIKKPGKYEGLVSLIDLAPTFLDAAGADIPVEMTGKSLLPLLTDPAVRSQQARDFIVAGKELHAWCHPEGEINPSRAIRNDQFLYIMNLKPDLWPAGHPEPGYNWDLLPYGDIDWGPTKEAIMDTVSHGSEFLQLSMGKRPFEELYDVISDPYNLKNLADDPDYQSIKGQLKQALNNFLLQTGDPRIEGNSEVFDSAPYFFSHGLATGGLRPAQWQALSTAGKEAQLQKARQLMQEKQERMREAVFN